MGRKNNVNPDHYKTAGREKPGQDVVQEIHKQKFAQSRKKRDAKSRRGIKPISESKIGQVKESANMYE